MVVSSSAPVTWPPGVPPRAKSNSIAAEPANARGRMSIIRRGRASVAPARRRMDASMLSRGRRARISRSDSRSARTSSSSDLSSADSLLRSSSISPSSSSPCATRSSSQVGVFFFASVMVLQLLPAPRDAPARTVAACERRRRTTPHCARPPRVSCRRRGA